MPTADKRLCMTREGCPHFSQAESAADWAGYPVGPPVIGKWAVRRYCKWLKEMIVERGDKDILELEPCPYQAFNNAGILKAIPEIENYANNGDESNG